MNTELGFVTTVYTESGEIIKELSAFKPTLEGKVTQDIEDEILNIKSSNSSEAIKSNATLLLASFFNKMTEIELADRSEYEIDSDVIECDKYPDGTVRKCVLRFFFKSIN